MHPDGGVTPSALRAYADAIVDGLLLENATRWRSLSPEDRRRVDVIAREVAARLFEEPARRIETARPAHVRALAELFALGQSRSGAVAERPRTRVSI